MVERTDERTVGSDTGDADLEDVLDDDFGGSPTGGGSDGDLDDGLGVDVDGLTSDPGSTGGTPADTGPAGRTERSGSGLLSRLTPSLGLPRLSGLLPSGRSVLLSVAVLVVSTLVTSAIPLLGAVGGLLGVFVGAFLLGLLNGTRRYLGVAVGGGTVAGISMLVGALELFSRVAILADTGLAPFTLIGITTGVLSAVLGHYFGRDLRAGLTRNV